MNETIVRAKIKVDASELDQASRKASEITTVGGSGGRATLGAPPIPATSRAQPKLLLPPPPIPGGPGGGDRSPPNGPHPFGDGGSQPFHPSVTPRPPSGPASMANLLIQNANILVQSANVILQGANSGMADGSGSGGSGGNGGGGGDEDDNDDEKKKRKKKPPWYGKAWRQGAGFAANTLSTATGVALGSSIMGFLTSSAEQYKENSKSLADMRALFGDVGPGAQAGYKSLGGLNLLVRERTGLLGALGAQTNQIDPQQALQAAAFARAYGLDLNTTATGIGHAQRLTGAPMGQRQLLAMRGQAMSLGMGGGMFPEYMETLQGALDAQFQATGQASLSGAMNALQTPAILFGTGSPLGQGHLGFDMAQRTHSMISGGSGGMKLAMLRAMGFGKEGGPSDLEAMERVEAGIYDRRNLAALFKRYRDQGRSADDVKRMFIPDARAAGIPLHALYKMVESGMSDEGFKRLQGGATDITDVFGSDAMAGMSDDQRRKFEAGGFTDIAKRGIGAGRAREAQMEGMMMRVGPQTLRSVMDLTETAANMGGAFDSIVKAFTGGDGFLDVINQATGSLRALSEETRNILAMPEKLLPQDLQDVYLLIREMSGMNSSPKAKAQRTVGSSSAPWNNRNVPAGTR